MTLDGFDTRSVRMERRILVTVQAPADDVDRIMDEVVKVAPLATGPYDRNAYQSGPGVERYRPLAGAAAGAESAVRKRPGVVEISFEVPDDRSVLDRVVEAIFEAHGDQEPVIRLAVVLASRSKGLDDGRNPNRWWNTTGDWRTPGSPEATDRP